MAKKKKPKNKRSSQSSFMRIAAGIFIVLLLFSMFGYPLFMNNSTPSSNKKTSPSSSIQPTQPAVPPAFKKEGELSFIASSGDTTNIAIELARTEKETTQGLMYRTSLGEKEGMLFLFKESEPRTFWMKNTYLSLDIIFVDESYKIVTIRPDTKPFSREGVSSTANALIVVEVNAGFCEKHGIQVGDKINFNLSKHAT